MKPRITVENGPSADAASAVGVHRVSAMPSADIDAVPSTTYTAKVPRDPAGTRTS